MERVFRGTWLGLLVVLLSGCVIGPAPSPNELQNVAVWEARVRVKPGDIPIGHKIRITSCGGSLCWIPDAASMGEFWQAYAGKRVRLKRYTDAAGDEYFCREGLGRNSLGQPTYPATPEQDPHLVAVRRSQVNPSKLIVIYDSFVPGSVSSLDGQTCTNFFTHGGFAHYYDL